MPTKEPTPNPLLSKNIPPPPPPVQAPAGNSPDVQSINNGGHENVLKSAVIEQVGSTTRATTTKKPVGDLATVELSLYLKSAQDDKLEDLRRAYKRHTGKKISANEVMRRLIERATLEMLL